MKLYSRIWIPHLEEIKAAILAVTQCKTIVQRLSRSVLKNSSLEDGAVIHGALPDEEIQFQEHGVTFSANVIKGHKTGFFLDHRHNRYKIQQLARGKTVLDVFSYAGGFAVHALVGGATEVTAVDISAQALSVANQNAQLNNSKLNILEGDAFEVLKKLMARKEKFDLIIIDPPSFAKAQDEVPVALKQYQRLAKLGIQLLARNGKILLASCSARVTTDDFYEACRVGLDSSRRTYSLLEKSFHDVDHPVSFPEGSYLKAGLFQLDN